MKSFKQMFRAAAVAAAVLVAGTASAANPDWTKYDGSISINETEFAAVLGGSVGGGVLTVGPKTYKFKVEGLTAGVNVGVSKVKGNGFVYNLKNVADFAGTYTQLDVSATGGAGAGLVHLKNEKGVIITLGTTQKGLQLNVGSATGVKIKLEQ
ncbi:MAG: hypothetical protein U1F08_00650 [Steroidobacteraceae bacterium]